MKSLVASLVLYSVSLSAGKVGPNVAYFRNHNMDHSSELVGVSADAASVTLHRWDTTINIFDTVQDVKVQRIDITGTPKATISLYSKAVPLHLSEGPMYIFHNATNLVVKDSSGTNYSAAKTDAVSWLSKGSCVSLEVELSAQGEASLIYVTSGAVKFEGETSPSCTAGSVLVGAGIKEGGGGGSGGGNFFYNEVKYTLSNSDSCSNPLTHGVNGYSQTDEPIGPLAAHYHTRGALYYTQYGQSKYNDEAAPNDTIYTGELRFVNAGVYYGPEEMDSSTCFVASVHESDPAAVNPGSEGPDSECPFACMNTLGGKSPSQCTRASTTVVQV